MSDYDSVARVSSLFKRFAARLETQVPGRVTVEAQKVKLQDEVNEFVEEPSMEELADVVVVAGMAAGCLGHDFEGLLDYVESKLRVNLDRRWYPTASGTARHTPEGEV